MKYIDFKKALDIKIGSLYMFKGDDAFLIDRSLAILTQKAEINLPELNISVFNDENYNMGAIINSLCQVPVVSEKRLVVLKNILGVSDSDRKQLFNYLEHINTDSILVIVVPNDNQNFKYIEKQAEIVEVGKLFPSMAIKIIQEEIAPLNIIITKDALELLLENTNYNLQYCLNEIHKLWSYTDHQSISKEDVKLLSATLLEFEVYELSNALATKNVQRTLNIINKMLITKQSPSAILGLISAHFRRMFYAITASPSIDLVSNLKVKEFAISKAKSQADSFGAKKLKEILTCLSEIDFMFKNGEITQENALYYLVFRILY